MFRRIQDAFTRIVWVCLLVALFPTVRQGATGEHGGQQTQPEFEHPLTTEQIEEGWIALFDGHSLFGWKAESEVNWRVEDGCIMADSGEVGLLRTTSQFDDFELTLSFKASGQTNSGVFIRTSPRPTDPAIDCYEVNIAPSDNPFSTASLVARQKANEFDPGSADEFHQMTITAQGAKIVVSVDGEVVNEYEDPRPLGRGYIGLQFNSGSICFRQVILRPLGQENIMSDPDGWNLSPDMPGKFEWTSDAVLRGFGGRGQLESRVCFEDFVLQATARTQGEDQNSGIFFRCIPGQVMNGYESQIDHEIIDDDPTDPGDFGTGGIFRRQAARRVMTKENQWFHKTIAVCGPHISVWVNGYQVVDWSDRRDPDPNPRRGLRLETGTIIIQLHDEASEIHFKKLSAKNLSPRGR